MGKKSSSFMTLLSMSHRDAKEKESTVSHSVSQSSVEGMNSWRVVIYFSIMDNAIKRNSREREKKKKLLTLQ